jgi:hypothetical protein
MLRDNRGAFIDRVSFSLSGEDEIRAGSTNKVIYVHSLFVIPSEDGVTVTLQSNGVDISPDIALIKAGNGFVLPSNGEYAWFATPQGGDLSIIATGQITGLVIFTQE